MVADAAIDAYGSDSATRQAAVSPPHRNVLNLLEQGAISTRHPDGSVSVRRNEQAGCFLYGPYLHLPLGRYRLNFRCRHGKPRMTAQPVLGVEIIVLSRFQQRWRDFTPLELAAGSGSVEFEVLPEHSLEGENEGRFEFRFFHFGNADVTIAAVELAASSDDIDADAPASEWHLLGRLQKTWLGRRAADGTVTVRRLEPAGAVLYGGWPYLRLPRGAYRLIVRGQVGAPEGESGKLLTIAIFGQSRWFTRRPTLRWARRPENNGVPLAHRDVSADDFGEGQATLDFIVPTEMSLEAGADSPVDIRIDTLANAALTIEAVDLRKLEDDRTAVPAAAPVVTVPGGRRKVVIIGNCQSETLRQGFAQIEALNRRFDVRYHFIQLPNNLHEYAARDLETCDVLLIQDIRLWDEFPLKEAVRAGADVSRFPLVRFGSLWPFDAWNGPGDKEAYDREAPNLVFPYLDGLLGRMRGAIVDPEERFRAYRDLDFPGIVNYRRLHDLEVRRLAAMDKKFDFAIGTFILENFASRRVFHTTVRPNWEVFSLLMQFVAKSVGAGGAVALTETVDASLRNPQVPIHPKVAGELGVKWIDDSTRYLNRGVAMSWEEYVRAYIRHYG